MHLINGSRLAQARTSPVSVSLDNTAGITSLRNQKTRPSQYIIDWIHDKLEDMDKDIAERLEVKWVPGHIDSRGNEAADEVAKEAAKGDSSSKNTLPEKLQTEDRIPVSISAMKRRLTKEVNRAWTEAWTESARYPKFRKFEKRGRGTKYEKLVGKLRRNQTSAPPSYVPTTYRSTSTYSA